MLTGWKTRVMGWLRGTTPVTEYSALSDIARVYPTLYSFLKRRYGLSLGERDRRRTFGDMVRRYGLPPPQIVFMEMQLEDRADRVKALTARAAADRVKREPWRIVDVREPWELRHGSIPGAEPMDPALWEKMLAWDKHTPILLYCHFGIRSLDAASQLSDRGFTNVHVLQGGVDAWSLEVDPSLPRYEGSWC